jgi:TNF receptor-associated protein 1
LDSYEITEADNVPVGTSIVIHLRDDCLDYANEHQVESIVKKYSNFIGFPIQLNGKRINTIQPLWVMVRAQPSHVLVL